MEAKWTIDEKIRLNELGFSTPNSHNAYWDSVTITKCKRNGYDVYEKLTDTIVDGEIGEEAEEFDSFNSLVRTL